MLAGHSSLDMCLRCLALAQSHADANHKGASPVMNWRLARIEGRYPDVPVQSGKTFTFRSPGLVDEQ